VRFPRDTPPSNLNALQTWISTWATQQGVAQDRAQRWIAFELIAAAFEAARLDADRPLFLLKGGFAMEIRLGLQARATKDLDVMLRADATVRQITDAVRAALGQPRCGGATTFQFASARQIGTMRTVRFDVRVQWHGQSLARVRLEVSPDEAGAALDWDSLSIPGRAADFGITEMPTHIECLQLRYQMAQKLHAVANPREPNDRFRDLIDLQMLDVLHDPDRDLELRDACEAVFSARAQHDWPPTLTVREGWESGYRALAGDLKFPESDVHIAVQVVQAMVDRLAALRH
jgi:hypothetical protein